MESLTKNRQSNETIEIMVKHILNKEIAHQDDAITELKDGWFNVAYLITLDDHQEVILKIAPNPCVPVMTYEQGMMKSEVSLLKKAKALGIPCPMIYGYDDTHTICDSDYFFMERLRGDSFEHLKSNLEEKTIQLINQEIGKLTHQWNLDTSSPTFGYIHIADLEGSTWKDAFSKMMTAVLSDGLKNHVDLGYEYAQINNLYHDFSEVLDEVLVPHFVHWDVWDSNVFIDDHKVSGILDFERGFYGDPLAEALFRMKEPNQLLGYGKTSFSPNEHLRMRLYDMYLALIMIIEDSYRNYDNHKIKEYGLYQLKTIVEELSSHK